MSELRTNKIVPRDGLPLSASGGGIIQVVSVTKTDAESLTGSSTPQLIPGMEATITPQSASNKILVMVCLHATVAGNYAAQYAVLRRNSTDICVGDAAGNRNRATISLQAPTFYDDATYGPGFAAVNHLDSPATTSAVTYSLYHAEADNGGNGFYVNRAQTDTDSTNFNRVASSITLMEISA